MSDAYTVAYLALCDAEEADDVAWEAYLALAAHYCTPEHDAAFNVWWPLREAREAARAALHSLPVPQEAAHE
jgi:hypothetical protein